MFSNHKAYIQGIKAIADGDVWSKLQNKNLLLTGATGLIGRVLVDAIMYRNRQCNDNIKLSIITRSKKNAENIFSEYLGNLFNIIEWDLSREASDMTDIQADFIIHGASNTHPLAYTNQPISTIMTVVNGTKNMLNLASRDISQRILFLSTVEIYGENKGDVERFTEDYLGYINCNTLRAGYPESKRTAEALCQAYRKEKNINVVIARLGRVFGPSTTQEDSKSTTQFIRRAVAGQDIVLKSEGTQQYSMIYVNDACRAIITLLTEGVNGEAYNVSNDEIIDLKTIAGTLAELVGTHVNYDTPNTEEATGFSIVNRALMDNTKLKNLGWTSHYTVNMGLSDTVRILQEEGVKA